MHKASLRVKAFSGVYSAADGKSGILSLLYVLLLCLKVTHSPLALLQYVTGKCESAELVLKVQLVPQPLKLIYAKLKRCGIGDTSIFFVIIHK